MMVGFIIGLFVGVAVGIGLAALMVMARQGD